MKNLGSLENERSAARAGHGAFFVHKDPNFPNAAVVNWLEIAI